MSHPFLLPVSVGGGASGWTLSDWQQLRATVTADATGTATVDFGQVDPMTQWLVDRVVIQAPTPAPVPPQTVGVPPTFKLYDTSVAGAQLLDGTASGDLNTADYPAGLLVRPSTSLVGQWTGTTAGGRCTITVQARILRQGQQR